jgi:AAA15 family ATPase/GTPase
MSNFQSFLDRTEVDFRVTKKASSTRGTPSTSTSYWVAESTTGELVTKVMCVMGANGAGKTALIKPLAFMGWFVSHSFQQSAPETPIPITPHALASDKPTEFECTVDFDKKLWRYVLVCTRHRVLREELFVKGTDAQVNRFKYVFTRHWDEELSKYEIKQQDFGFIQSEAEKVRPNASLISTAAQYGVELAARLVTVNVATNVNLDGRVNFAVLNMFQAVTQHYAQNDAQRDAMDKLLSSWDLGLSGVDFRPVSTAFNLAVPGQSADNMQQSPPLNQTLQAFGRHRSGDTEFFLPFYQESNGTRSAFILLAFLLSALEEGGIAVIDELEHDLHPHMLEPILDLFANPETNPKNSQLIFTCHTPEILRSLQKYQITLAEKVDCQSDSFRLDQIDGIRSIDNYYAKYMAGAFGAVPRFGTAPRIETTQWHTPDA